MATFVIVHGGWSGGWYFQPTARRIRAVGHEVYTPTLTGIGERVHLASPHIDLNIHVQDIVNVLEYEDLHEVILVGYSYGGMVITVVADRVPERLAQLIYLDAFVPQDGQSLADLMPELAAHMEQVAREVGDGWRVPHDPPLPRKTDQPIGGMREPVVLKNAVAAALPRTYVLFTQNSFPHAPVMARMAAEAQAAGWRYRELAADHIAPETHPQELAALLLELGEGVSLLNNLSPQDDDGIYNAKLNDASETNSQTSLSLPQISRVHVSTNGPLLLESYSNELETAIADLVRQEISVWKQKSPPKHNQSFEISLKALGLDSALEAGLIASISERLQTVLDRQQASSGEIIDRAQSTHHAQLNNAGELGESKQAIHSQQQGLCICTATLPGSEYPFINPRSVGGPLPHNYGVYFYEDVLGMKVEDAPALSGCQMWIALASKVQWEKEIVGWNLCSGQVSSVKTYGSNTGPNMMLIEKADCLKGVHTIIFRKAKFLGSMSDMYSVDPDTFWPFYGGKKVTFTWISDTQGTGLWGHQSTPGRPGFTDGTLLKGQNSPQVFVIYGGAKFWIPDPNVFDALGFDWNNVRTVSNSTIVAITTTPGDGTLLKEQNNPAIFVFYGGAKFWIPNPNVFHALGFDWNNVRTVPDNGLAALPNIPREATLLKELSFPDVFVIRGGSRFRISSPQRFHDWCFYWENVRIVPDGALNMIPVGGVL